MTITRYRPDSDDNDNTAMMWEDKEGDYVAFEDYEDEVNALKADNKRLRNALSLITSFIPIGWAMPLGFYNVLAQAKDALKMEDAK